MLLAPRAAAAAVAGSVDVVSDYRFRGVSLSDRNPALQATVHVTKGAFFAEGFVTTLGGGKGEGEVETDLTLGGTKKIGRTTVALSTTWYLYPGGEQKDVLELIGRLDQPIGPATLSFLAGYAPAQKSLHGEDNLYLSFTVTVPIGRPELFASIGRERGAQVPGTKLDWQIGTQMTVHGFHASLSYVDCDRDLRNLRWHRVSKAGVVFQVGHDF
jgi:uncharacterized protein (TIGR02001 family)